LKDVDLPAGIHSPTKQKRWDAALPTASQLVMFSVRSACTRKVLEKECRPAQDEINSNTNTCMIFFNRQVDRHLQASAACMKFKVTILITSPSQTVRMVTSVA